MDVPAALTRYRREVDDHLRSITGTGEVAELNRMLRYHLGWEDARGRPAAQAGKGLRPSLLLLACEATGGDRRRALPAAAAVELIHNFSLVHDDIQDRDAERRHRPTVWSVWGEAQAINAGDALLALGRLTLLELADRGVPPEAVVKCARLLDKRTLEMVEGQVIDLSFEGRLDVSLDEYLKMVAKKTGALFDCSLAMGALVAGAGEPVVEAMGRAGRSLGLAFQVRDDMLGVWGAENRTGKQPAADVRRRKKSLPVVFAFQRADGALRRRLEETYRKDELDDEDVSAVLQALDALGAHGFCARLAAEHKQAALDELERLQLKSRAARELRESAEFLLERDF